MHKFLKNRIGKKLGITRFGIPKEVYFEATLKSIEDDVAVFENEQGEEFALEISKIIMVGPPEKQEEETKPKPGFVIEKKENG